MDIKNLMTFIQVAELNNFTKASQKLGYSQSTISFQIKQLETELGFPLFDRVNHTIVLTEKGRAVLDYAHSVRRITSQFYEDMKGEKELTGHIRLGMSDSLCYSLFRDNFQAFRETHPGITLKIIAAGTEEMFRLIDHNEVDAILTLDSHIYDTNYVIVHEEQILTHFVAAPTHPLAGKSDIPLSELAEHAFILTEKNMSYRRFLDEAFARHSIELSPILETGNAQLLAELASQNIGISFLPDFVTDSLVQQGKLVHLSVSEPDFVIWKQIFHHKSKWITPQIEAVLNYCAAKRL